MDNLVAPRNRLVDRMSGSSSSRLVGRLLHIAIGHDPLTELLSSLVDAESSTTVEPVHFEERECHPNEGGSKREGGAEHDKANEDVRAEYGDGIRPANSVRGDPYCLNEAKDRVAEI